VRAVYNLARGRGFSEEIFDLLYTIKPDPWRYRTSRLERGKYQDLLDLLPAGEWARALEIGCSEGVFTEMLAGRVHSLQAVDFSPTALFRARQALAAVPNVELRHMNIREEDPGGSYDLIVASEVLYYMGDVEQIRALGRRMMDWLKPGGHLLLCHMRSRFDDIEGFPVPRFTPSHPGAHTVHGIFDEFPQLSRLAELVKPLYKVSLYQRS
jgi:trans-aconitate methyltransferase